MFWLENFYGFKPYFFMQMHINYEITIHELLIRTSFWKEASELTLLDVSRKIWESTTTSQP
jgi:hypothetical protein